MKKICPILFCLITGHSFGQIVINELDADTPGSDREEFIELKWTPNTPLDGFVVVLFNGGDNQSYKRFDLAGKVTDADGFFVLANSSIATVSDIDIGSGVIQNGPDAIAIYQGSAADFPNGTAVTLTNLIDALIYGTADPDATGLLTGLGESVQYDESVNGNSANESLQRNSTGDYKTAIPTFRLNNSFPAISSTPNSLSGFDYIEGSGPSDEISFTISGDNLIDGITISSPANYEISTISGGGFTNILNLTQSAGSVPTTTIFVRLIAGLAIAEYTGSIDISSNGATPKTVSLNGNVIAPAALTHALIITGIIDGPLAGGLPKAVELFAANDIPDLSLFGIRSVTNGGGVGGGSGSVEFTFPAGTATAGQFLYLSFNDVGFLEFFGFDADMISGAISGNGNDAYELYENNQIIDIFGNPNMDGSGELWDYTDGWAYRIGDTGPDGNNFVQANWIFSGINALDNETTNVTAASPLPIGTFSLSTLSVSDFSKPKLPKIYPNPVTKGFVNIISGQNSSKTVTVYDLQGRQHLQKKIDNSLLEVSQLPNGVYILKIEERGRTISKKLIIQN